MGWFPEHAGGLNRMYYNLIRHLPAAGVSARGLITGTPQSAPEAEVEAFAPARAPLPVRLWNARRALREALALHPPDLVAAHFALYALPALDLINDPPLVVHFHGPWAGESAAEDEYGLAVKAKEMLERFVYRRGTRFIVLSEAFRRVLASQYDVPEQHIRRVPGGVETDRFDVDVSAQEARRRLGWPQDRPIVLSVRRLTRRMGLEALITAMKAVREKVPDVLLLVAGKGPLADELEARIRAAGLEAHIRLLGFVPDEELPLAYRAAYLSVVPTVALEGFGLVAVESLAAGTPVLVTPVGGLPEVVHDLNPNLVLEGSTPAHLGARIAAVLMGQGRWPSAEACQQYAREHFEWSVIAKKTRHVYEEVT